MAKCSFCGKTLVKGTGKMFVKDNGQVLWFHTSKCEKNYLGLKRDPRKFKWTSSYVKGQN
jgi:large subunit ribosomal protein L24e